MQLEDQGLFQWLRTGDEAFDAMLGAIRQARATVRLETYIFANSPIGRQFRDELTAACQRGVHVRVLVDAFGSMELSDNFWLPLRKAGGECRWFNPLTLRGFGFRDHRKLLVCDEEVAFLGGFNIAPEYQGDGVARGWCDHGIRIENDLAVELAAAFDGMFARSALPHRPFTLLRKSKLRQNIINPLGELLLCAPGRGLNHFKRILLQDLHMAKDVQIISAYFLPNGLIRRRLNRVARHGGKVQLIIAEKSDVPLAQLAGQSLFQRLMRAGVEIYEYQPQILHSKLVVIDGAVYVGSANLDTRSLHINYELMMKVTDPAVVAGARDIFNETLKHCRRIDPEVWRKARSFWGKIKERWAHFLLARVDPYIARRQLRTLKS